MSEKALLGQHAKIKSIYTNIVNPPQCCHRVKIVQHLEISVSAHQIDNGKTIVSSTENVQNLVWSESKRSSGKICQPNMPWWVFGYPLWAELLSIRNLSAMTGSSWPTVRFLPTRRWPSSGGSETPPAPSPGALQESQDLRFGGSIPIWRFMTPNGQYGKIGAFWPAYNKY